MGDIVLLDRLGEKRSDWVQGDDISVVEYKAEIMGYNRTFVTRQYHGSQAEKACLASMECFLLKFDSYCKLWKRDFALMSKIK